jgi:PA-IL-like protein/EF hand domain-containing protein
MGKLSPHTSSKKEMGMVATKTTASKRFENILAGTFLLLTSAAQVAAQEPISWTNQANVALRGDRLEKTGGCDGCDDAGAISRQIIRSGDGAVEFTIGEDHTFWRAGLSRSTGGMRVGNIDFAVRLNGNGRADVMENGVYVGGDTEYRGGDVFRVEVVAGRVRYLKNGQVMHVSQKWPTYPLVFDVALGSRGATIANARIETRESAVATSDINDEFRRLDRNDDGLISRREWLGTRGIFNQRDANRDGLLTRREMGLDEPAAVGTAGFGDFIIVGGTDQWTDTGLTLRPGDRVTFNAEGTIHMSPDPNDTAGPEGSRRLAPDAPLGQQAAGTLIARIGDGAPIAVGASRTITARGGRLLLGVNDDYLGDNSGEFRVVVTIEPR